MTPGTKLAEGRTAEVFAWGDDRVLKLFREGRGADFAVHEATVAEAIYASGAPSPRAYGTTEVVGRAGVIYERIAGPSLLAVVVAQPWRLTFVARTLAEVHAAMHARQVANLPALRGRLERHIRAAVPLPPTHRDAALRALDALPDGEALCHGDFHPDNVLLAARGPLVIDWENATHGDPLFDVARTLLLVDTAPLHATSARGRMIWGALAWTVRALYLNRYRRLRPFDATRLQAWRLPVAAARLSEGIVEEEAYLLARVRRLAGGFIAAPVRLR